MYNVKFKTLKRVKKNYDEVFTDFKHTDEIQIKVGAETISIINQQVGIPLNTPYVEVTSGNSSYSMNWHDFIRKIRS